MSIIYKSLAGSDIQGFHPMVRYRSPKPLMGVRIPQPLLHKRAEIKDFREIESSFLLSERLKFWGKMVSKMVSKMTIKKGYINDSD